MANPISLVRRGLLALILTSCYVNAAAQKPVGPGVADPSASQQPPPQVPPPVPPTGGPPSGDTTASSSGASTSPSASSGASQSWVQDGATYLKMKTLVLAEDSTKLSVFLFFIFYDF